MRIDGNEQSSVGQMNSRLSDHAVILLRSRILSGAFPDGTPLSRNKLSTELGISRTPLSEAFWILAAEGLVSIEPNKRAIVSLGNGMEAIDTLATIGRLASLAGKLACDRMSIDMQFRLEEIGRNLSHFRRIKNEQDYDAARSALYANIVEGANCAPLAAAWHILIHRVEPVLSCGSSDGHTWSVDVRWHKQVIAAMSTRAGTEAANRITRYYASRASSLLMKMRGSMRASHIYATSTARGMGPR